MTSSNKSRTKLLLGLSLLLNGIFFISSYLLPLTFFVSAGTYVAASGVSFSTHLSPKAILVVALLSIVISLAELFLMLLIFLWQWL